MITLNLLHQLPIIIVFTPLIGALIAGLLGKRIGTKGAHWVTIIGVAISCLCAIILFKLVEIDNAKAYHITLYQWVTSGNFNFSVSFMIDHLTTIMMMVVTSVSLLVHIYSIGYMKDDPGYQRFFAYMSAFTFAMLTLVAADNFMLLFFGWEGVGVVSYLLIGFWFKKDSASTSGFKAFLVNRVGDFGFLLGLAVLLGYFGSVDYATVFAKASSMATATISLIPGHPISVITLASILLFVGAMGKSAQVPLHVWLPESMEGPTPISALIHAATMVTAGVYMVARISPMLEYSQVALSVILIVGAAGALFMGLIGLVQNDIKKVIAYSTMSQLGYMMAANGASAFSAGIFHLATHAFFKALLFLGAGSVIIAMHHEQDLRNMGNLKKYMPITYITFLIGSLSLAALPPFAGFYSKDAIIEAVKMATIPGAGFAYVCLLVGAFVTALYTFRALFLAFHTEERFDQRMQEHLHESPKVVWIPLAILAVPSVIIGAIMAIPMLYGEHTWLSNAIFTLPKLNVLAEMREEYHGLWHATYTAVLGLPFWFSVAGIATAWVCYIKRPELPERIMHKLHGFYNVLVNKYWFDAFNQNVIVKGACSLGRFCYRVTDLHIIDGWFVNGSGRAVKVIAGISRRLQTGYLFHYALTMIVGLVMFLCWLYFSG